MSFARLPSPRLAYVAASALRGSLFVVGVATACSGNVATPVPLDGPVFPTGLALSADGNRLLVGSSNYDFAYDSGAVLLADVTTIRDELLASADPATVVASPWIAGIAAPEFADRLTFTADGNTAVFTTREGNLLHTIDVGDDAISCGNVDVCDSGARVLQLAGNDPFDITLLDDDGTVARGLVSHLRDPTLEIFQLNRTATARLTIEHAIDLSVDDNTSIGVRATVVLPAAAGHGEIVFAAVERQEASSLVGVDLVRFALPAANDASAPTLRRQDVTSEVGSRTMRDVVLVHDDVTGGDALVAIVQGGTLSTGRSATGDALVRFAIDPVDQHVTLTNVAPTCRQPVALAAANIDIDDDAVGDVSRLLVACHGSNELVSVDPLTLQMREVNRFYGRGPYDVVVDAVHQLAYVSFFFDNSVGVFRLVDNGAVSLTPIGRLGAALPRPEDGRE
jgi:hypothetical protein